MLSGIYFVASLLVFQPQLANAAEGPDSGLGALLGAWEPGSRAYEGYPGSFEISESVIRFDVCDQPLSIVRDTEREDGWWRGLRDRNVRRYRDVVVRIRPNPKCESIPETLFRFLIVQDIECFAVLMVYSSDERLDSARYDSWGTYHRRAPCKRNET
jgi:hypothetical protein